MDIVNIIDIVIAIWLIGAIVLGYFTGLVMKIAQFASVILAYAGAYLTAKIVSENINIELASHAAYSISFIIAFIIINAVLRHLIKILKIVDHIPVIGVLNHIGGAVVGFLVDFVIILIICSIVFKWVPQGILDSIGFTKSAINNSMLLSVFVL